MGLDSIGYADKAEIYTNLYQYFEMIKIIESHSKQF